MFLSNYNNNTLLIFIILFIIWLVLLFLIYKQNKKLISTILLFLSLFFVIINIFEIKWWYDTKIEKIKWWKIVFVLDVSKSMDTIDVKKDYAQVSRLTLSKWIIENFIIKNINDYWLLLFAWDSLETIPFTNDIWIFTTILNWVTTDSVFVKWTNLNKVFENLNTFFTPENDIWLVVLLTDWWEEQLSIDNKLLDNLQSKWIEFLIIWVWTTWWSRIPIWFDYNWTQLYKTYKWLELVSKLNKNELKRISNKYNFSYVDISDFSNYSNIESLINEYLKKVEISKNISYRVDYTRFFIMFSFIFFILFLLSDNFLWRRK